MTLLNQKSLILQEKKTCILGVFVLKKKTTVVISKDLKTLSQNTLTLISTVICFNS